MLAFNSISKFKQYQTILLCISVYTIYYIYVQKQLECCFQFSPWFIDVYTIHYTVREIGEITLLIGLPQIEIGFHYLNYWQLLWKFIVLKVQMN